MTEYIGLDFETYSATDITKHGLDRYVNDPHFRPLIGAVQHEDGHASQLDFILRDYQEERQRLLQILERDVKVCAHNAGFEQAVLNRMEIHVPSAQFIDSAVVARAAGAAGKLEAAGPQLLGIDKMASGWDLIKLFSIPAEGVLDFDRSLIAANRLKWDEFMEYCILDAKLSLKLVRECGGYLSDQERVNNAVTMDMNNVGWHVDMKLVHNMHTRYLLNVKHAVQHFRDFCVEPDLNLNSSQQMIEWCKARGVRATSFDEAHVERMLKAVIKKRDITPPGDKMANLNEVALLLATKQIMGGSSLKKLQTIIDTVGTDGRLHDQYLHIGAGATFRTTGRGVQMQNLKRLGGEGDDVELLFEPDVEWANDQLARNLRQVFTATDPNGFLIVGDFASVESRGLAWQAGEQWKLDAYHQGEDLYKVQAGLIFGKHKAHVTKAERTVGKVGELACGYGAGADAVREFAAKMHVELSEGESAKLVRDWRGANPKIVEYWYALDDILHQAVETGLTQSVMMKNVSVIIEPIRAPRSLRQQTGNQALNSLEIRVWHGGKQVLLRVIHGVEIHGRNIHYWKPSERKTGNLWVDTWMNPKTKRQQPFTVYGGKLSGLLTQSLCREVFFDTLRKTDSWVGSTPGVRLVGQFHDEIVLDWAPDPNGPSLEQAKDMLNSTMSVTKLKGFPLAAEIKSDYRYTK